MAYIGKKTAALQKCLPSTTGIDCARASGNEPSEHDRSVGELDFRILTKLGISSEQSTPRLPNTENWVMTFSGTRLAPSRTQFFKLLLCSDEANRVSLTSSPAEYSNANGRSKCGSSRDSSNSCHQSLGSLEAAILCPVRRRNAILRSAIFCRVVSNIAL